MNLSVNIDLKKDVVNIYELYDIVKNSFNVCKNIHLRIVKDDDVELNSVDYKSYNIHINEYNDKIFFDFYILTGTGEDFTNNTIYEKMYNVDELNTAFSMLYYALNDSIKNDVKND